MLILKVKKLKKTYNNKNNINKTNALNGIDFAVGQGEFVGIMGPSGSGKTTLLNVLSGIAKPTAGEIEILGQSVKDMSKHEMTLFRRKHLGFVFQDFNLLDSLTLEENIMLPLSLESDESEERYKKVNEVMTMFNIVNVKNKYPYLVSGGQQQRAAIGRAIINEPDIIFADEPTGNLDWKSSNIVMNYFKKLNLENKNTILVVTHDPFTASYCKRIVFIKDGLIHSEITNNDNDKQIFFNKILENLNNIGDEKDDL